MRWIPKQRMVGRFIGGLKELLARVTFYISILNFLMIIATTYYTTVRHVYDMPFWQFFLILATIVVVAMIFEYTIVMPSQIAFLNWQAYTHDNPIRKDLEKVMAKLEEIEKEIEKLKEV